MIAKSFCGDVLCHCGSRNISIHNSVQLEVSVLLLVVTWPLATGFLNTPRANH
jgi:hypothetical protein